MKNGSPPQHHNVEYILFAEFDNKLGSILRCQYPKVIPIAHAINLASLMIPDNAERYPGRVDFTYFILYWNPISKEYELLPSEQNSIKGEHKILYFINVCNAILDPNNRRGATIQSVALGSHNPDFIKWKPFVTLLLDHIMKDQTNNNTEQLQTLLSPFLTRINKIDSFNNIPQRYLTQQIIQSVNDSVYEQTIIDNLIQPLLKYLPSIQDKYGNKVTTSHGLIQIFLFSGILPKLSSPMFYKTPICENILNESYIHTTIEYSRLALKIIRDVTLVLSHRNDIQAIFIYSNNLEKDSLGQLIFTISFLISGASISRSPSSSNVFPLPYVDISMLETLRDFIGTMRNMNYKIIVGVSNPIFKVQEDLYDIFYDIDEEKVQLSNNIKLIETEWKRQTLNILTRPYKLNDNINSLSRGLSNLNFKERVGVALSPLTPGNNSGSNSNSISLSNSSVFSSSLSSSNISNGRLTLMTSFMQLLIQEHHDNRTVLNVLKRIQILQLSPLLESIGVERLDIEIVMPQLIKAYHDTYNDLIYFQDLFDIVYLKFLKLLSSLHGILLMIMNPSLLLKSENYDQDNLYLYLSQLHDVFKRILILVKDDDKNIRKLIYICMNFPSMDKFSHLDIKDKDFKNFDIKTFYTSVFFDGERIDNYHSKSKNFNWFKPVMSNITNSNNYPIVDKFVENVAFNMIGTFLNFLPNMKSNDNIRISSSKKAKKEQDTLAMPRSRSFRNLFSLKVNSDPSVQYSRTMRDTTTSLKNRLITSSGSFLISPPLSTPTSRSSLPRQPRSFESIPMSFKRTSKVMIPISPVLETRINKIKSMICELFDLVKNEDELGEILLNGYLLDDIKTAYKAHTKSQDSPIIITSEEFKKPAQLPITKSHSWSQTSIVSSLNKPGSVTETREPPSNTTTNDSESDYESEDDEEAIFFEVQHL